MIRTIPKTIEKLRQQAEALFDCRSQFTDDDRWNLSNVVETLNAIVFLAQDASKAISGCPGSAIAS